MGASLIAEIIPDLRELTPSAKAPPPTRDPNTDSTARYWFFDALTQFIKKASNVRPWLLLLDDLHWWDEPSLRLLSYLVREMTDSPVMIIAAYRDSELYTGIEFKQVIADLTRDQLFERMPIRGLTSQDVDRFVELTVGTGNQSSAEALHRRTDGNPLFVVEMVKHLFEAGNVEEMDVDSLAIPAGIKDVVGWL